MAQANLVSPDNQWRWDGQQWQPNLPPPTLQAQHSPTPQAPKHAGSKTWIWIVSVVAAALVIVTISSIAFAPRSATPARTATGAAGQAATAPATAAPTTAPTAVPATTYAVGDTIETTTGAKLTVFQFVPVTSDNQFLRPKPGNQYVAIDVQEQAGPDGRSANMFDWALRLADNTRIQPTVSVKEPPLNSADLGANDAVRGWVTFEIPAGAKPAWVVLVTSTDIRWSVP
jgi:hypothetical protein